MAGRTELGEFLRSCRATVTPESVGLAEEAGRAGRRVRGLRREEVARLAGVSVDYYTRLEQGRHASPSAAVVDALARALLLDAAARAHLAALVRPGPSRPERPQPQRVRPSVHRLLDSFVDHPAFLVGRRTDVLAANPLARALITDWDALPARHRTYVRWLLLDPAARETYEDWAVVAAEAVGTLRLDAGRHPHDPLLERLVGELTVQSPEFPGWWREHRVHERTHGTKRMRHPVIGSLVIHFEALALPGDPDQTLFVYDTEPGSPSRDGMRLLASWIAQHPARRDPAVPPATGSSA